MKLQTLTFDCPAESIGIFSKYLQKGFQISIDPGRSISVLLQEHVGIPADYVKNRINTIFLNGKAVDDVESAFVFAGSRLALSAAMPGFVGAAFRKGGFFAGMRSSITHRGEPSGEPNDAGTCTIRLFNLLIEEIGPIFLERGIILENEDAFELMKDLQASRLCRHSTPMPNLSDSGYLVRVVWTNPNL
jgi:hypothetical protein